MGSASPAESWADLLRSCRRRGMTAPVLAVGDGALGFWKALREVFPATREQRCWFHVSSNVLPPCRSRRTQVRKPRSRRSTTPRTATTPCRRSKHSMPTTAPSGPRRSEDHRAHRRAAGVLRLPGRALVHLRTTNPIETTFATVRLRSEITKGRGKSRRRRDGVQAHRVRTSPLARRRRTPPRRSCPRRR